MHNYCCRQLYRPRSPTIVWEIPRVQRVSYILLIDAGTSLQQIHKLSECDLAFSLFPGILSQNVSLTPVSLQDSRKSTCLKSPAKLVISRSVLSKWFYFSKDAALGLDHRCNCFQCVSFRPVSSLFHSSCTPFCHYTSGICFNLHDFYCPNEFLFTFPMFSIVQPQTIILSCLETINHKSIHWHTWYQIVSGMYEISDTW